MSNGISSEISRLLGVIAASLLFGASTGYWLICLLVGLLLYIGWLYFKLNQLYDWMRLGAKPEFYPEGGGIWSKISVEVNALYRKNAKRKKRTQKLIGRFQSIIRGLPYATVVLNEINEVVWANHVSESLLNIKPERDRGQRVDNLVRNIKFSEILRQQSPEDITISLPGVHHKQLLLQVIWIQDDLKLLIAQDVSDYVNAQHVRRNFIANASHELRTPLTVISGYLEMMQSYEEMPDSLKPVVDTTYEQAHKMKMIVEAMLTLSRLERSDLDDDDCSQVNVSAILQVICKEEVQVMSDSGHKVELSADPIVQLYGSESEVTSVCTNLIYNAIRHTPPGTQVNVLWYLNDDQEAVLSVEDNGEGIPMKHLSRLTERFYRVEEARGRDTGGTGLGLAIVQHIMNRHQGRLEIDSAVGKGTTFKATFAAARVRENIEAQMAVNNLLS